jgi:hypothetical protein
VGLHLLGGEQADARGRDRTVLPWLSYQRLHLEDRGHAGAAHDTTDDQRDGGQHDGELADSRRHESAVLSGSWLAFRYPYNGSGSDLAGRPGTASIRHDRLLGGGR